MVYQVKRVQKPMDAANTPPTSCKANPLPMLLSVKNIELLGISRSAFYRISHCEGAPTVKIGNRVYLRRDDLLPWLKNHYLE